MDFAEVIGYAAATVSTFVFVPQVIRTWKLKSARDISMATLVMMCTGLALWVIYGAMTGQPPIIAANAIVLALASAILAMKIKFDG
ncbi:MAG: SemiSWEET transporter [Nitrospinae bacterium]|nr:SemiSWEET transporter [Nitrospinota bacterium]MBF0633764.1 SemiSWEET transporter [Nitrospinota bacterium]